MTILTDTKTALTIDEASIIFDSELLLFINAAVSILRQLGVDYFVDLPIISDSNWPAFGDDKDLFALSKTYLIAKVKTTFDPSANGTIQQTMTTYVSELEARIVGEAEHIGE